ncbi:MAG TPA: hypothetical protein GX707_20845 [Epulopiscium sp.]|nr:hypothetical protein [Candidatus Epulonipiscium sp.]
MSYDLLMMEIEEQGIVVVQNERIGRLDGLYIDGIITLHSRLETTIEKKCILAEELGHHYTSYGDIRNQSIMSNRKQELKARRWGCERLVSLNTLIEAYKFGCRSRYETAQYIEVTEKFLEEVITYYFQKHGLYKEVGKYTIFFNPLGVMERY